ncbi:MAG: histidinol dehydrogenase [Anaerolineae bacterium]|nr:histidinol dehydrogenase [Gloeobacterales cyanobacterium ES-bin-313]
MLRLINQFSEAETELRRIANRTHSDQVPNKEATVREILQNVRRQGDEALLRYTQEFDRISLSQPELMVRRSELDSAYQRVSIGLLKAIRLAKQRIEQFHRERIPKSWVQFQERGVVLGKRYTPIDAAGLYVPGGQASYPSSVLMAAIPALVAGVKRVVMVTPPGTTGINPVVLVAAQEAGVHEIYRVGGAQAIGALAYGTATIAPVDVICGPGNIYVTLAKKIVYGEVGIDSLAGPSEVLIIADSSANPAFIAADMLAQAEHDSLASSILITNDLRLAERTLQEVTRQLENHPRRVLTEKSLANYGLVIVTADLDEAAQLSNRFAPEHLELEVEDPWEYLEKIRHAGAIFMGHATPEAVGDYLAGPSHILPTARTARFASGVGVETFLKASSLVQYTPQALAEVGEAIDELTNAEGLPSHGDSVRLRLQSYDQQQQEE